MYRVAGEIRILQTTPTCDSCSAALPASFDRTCPRCGWDNRVGLRKCVSCRGGVVVLHDAIGYGGIGGVVGVGWLVFWPFFGVLIGERSSAPWEPSAGGSRR